MQVLMFGWEFPPFISGGLGTACFGLTKSLVEQGTDVTFVLPKLHSDAGSSHVRLVGADKVKVKGKIDEVEALKKKLQLLEVGSPIHPYMTCEQYDQLAQDTRLKQRLEGQAYQVASGLTGNYGPDLLSEIHRYGVMGGLIAQDYECDIIHSHDWMTAPAGIEAKKATGRPLVTHVHATEFDRSGEHVNQAVYDIERKGMEASDRIIAVSHYTKNIVTKRYGIHPDKIRVVHNGVNQKRQFQADEIKRNLKEKIVTFLGRITFQKGPDYFIETARKVIARIPDIRFVMAGSGDMYNGMVERMAALRLGKHFHFTGFLRGKDVDRMFAMSDLYVMPSVSEPFGISPLEAILYDLPVIISKQSGVAEVLDHAVKIDFWDTDKTAEAIIEVFTDKQKTENMVRKNRDQLTHITWDKAAEKVLNSYMDILQGAA